MQDHEKTKDQLINELNEMRSRIAKSETYEAKLFSQISRTIGEDAAIERHTEIDVDDVLKERLSNLDPVMELGATEGKNHGEFQKSLEALLHSAEEYFDLYNNAPNAFFSIGTDGNIIRVNPRAGILLGIPHQDLIGKPVFDFYADTPAGKQKARTVFSRFKAGEDILDEELQMLRLGGDPVWISLTVNAVRDASGQNIESRSMVVDITERKLAEEAAREIGERYRQLVENANDIIFQTNEGGFFTFANPVGLQLTGYTEKEILGKHYTELILPDYRERVMRFYGRQFVKRLPVTYNEFPLVTKHGMTLWIGQNTQLIMDGETVVGFQSIARDITELKHMEEELRTSEEKFSKAFFLSPDAILITQLIDGKIVSVNEGFKQLSGYVEEEFVGKTIPEINIWDSPEDRNRWIEKLKAEGKVDNFEARFRTKDGDTRYGLMSASTLVINGVDHILNVVRDITDRKQAEDALKAEKQRFQSLGENSPFGMVMIQPDGTFSYANPKFKEMFGYDLSDVPNGREWFRKAYPDPDYRHEAISSWMEHVKSSAPGETTPRVFRVTCKDGTEKIVHFRPVKLDSGEDMLTCENITELKQAEETLKKREQMLRTILSISPVGIGLTQDRVMKWVNEAWVRIFGFQDEGEPIGLDARHVYPSEEEYARVGRILYPKLETGVTTEVDASFQRKDSSVFDGHIRMRAIYPSDPSRGTIAAISDITQRKRMEEELRISEEKFSKAFFLSPDSILITRLVDGMIVSVNEGFKQLSGYVEDEVVGKTSLELNLWDNPEDRNRVIEGLKTEGKVNNFEFRFRTKDGDIRYGLMSAAIIELNGVEHILNITRDITERKLAEEQLRESEERFRVASQSMTDVVWEWDLATGGLKWFGDIDGLLGYAPGEFPRTIEAWEALIDPEDHNRVMTALDRHITEGYQYDEEYRVRRKDGGISYWQVRGTAIRDTEGKAVRMVGAVSDITDRKRAEQERENLRSQLLQSQKMETMGTLAGGIAHDFNNMLAIILGFSDMLLADKNEGDPGYEELRKIVKTSEDAADLVQRIRIFGRKAEMNLIPLDLNHQVDEVTKLLSSTLPKMIEMDIHLTKDTVIIKADSSQIAQMVMNLAVNAGEAMPQGGRLSIQTENIVLDDDYCRPHVGVKPGPHVMLTVSDTGRGIDKGLMERIFDPFYSTKMRDYHKGTGLGLSVVQGIVQQHGGHITVESEVGRGTTFRMYFPALEVEIVPEYVEKEIPYPAGGNETILLVEDWEMVRELGVTILEKFGYTVLSACDGQEALEVYEKEQGNISLVILDILMPRMDGKECLEELLRINPAVKVIISSGVGHYDLINDIVKIGAKGAVNKPYGMRQILGMVREVLDGD